MTGKADLWDPHTKKVWDEVKVLVAEHEPFFAHIAYGLKEVIEPDIPTLGTDGKSLFVNPDFLKGRIRYQLAVLRLHEIGHVVLKHCIKLRTSWQHWCVPCRMMAMDDVVDNWIYDTATWIPQDVRDYSWCQADPKDPDRVVHPFDRNMAGKTTEECYAIRHKHHQQNPQQPCITVSIGKDGKSCCQAPTSDGDKEGKGKGQQMSAGELQALEEAIDNAIMQAAKVAKARGKVPAGMERLLEEIIQPKEDPFEKLRRLVGGAIPDDYTWARPNKKYIGQGIYLSHQKKSGVGRAAFAVDTSGSMHPKELSLAWGVFQETLLDKKPEKIYLIFTDAAIAHVEEIQPEDQPDFGQLCKGGGGTDFKPVFDWLQENRDDVDFLAYFTDLECCAEHLEDPGMPVYWVCCRPESSVHESWKPSFGEFVYVTPQQ